ncbi:MAG: HAD-IA family hydrolase [Patescibacteria group bacterium]
MIFDVDGTLLDSFEANLKFYQDLMSRSGYGTISRKTYATMMHLSRREMIRSFVGASEEEMGRVWTLSHVVASEMPIYLLRTPPGTAEIVKLLHKKYLLGIVTSGLCDTIYKPPELAALRPFFQTTVSYEDTASHKPDPEPLLLAARHLGISPKEAVYIGDMPSDLAAARAAHMKIIIYGKNPIEEADGYISSFHELPERIAML